MNFTQNFYNLKERLERDMKKLESYNDSARFQALDIIRQKARAYRDILQPLVLDDTMRKINTEVRDFDKELKIIQERCNSQIDKILGDTI